MSLPLDITSPVNQKNPLSAASMHGRSSTGHNDGLSEDHNGIISDDRFKKEISDLLEDGAIDQTNSIVSHQALPMMQAHTFFVLPAAALTSLHVPDSDITVSTLMGETDTGTGNRVQEPPTPYSLHPLLKDLLLPGDLTDIIGKEGLDSSDTNLRPGPFQDNHAIGKGDMVQLTLPPAPYPLPPLLGETGPGPDILACQSGDRGDLNNEPGIELEPKNEIDKKHGLSLRHVPSNKGDFSDALENFTDKAPDTKLHSTGYQGGEEEAKEAYIEVRRGADDEANAGSRMKATWYDRIIADSNPDLNLNGSYSRLPAPSGNTRRTEAGPLQTVSPEKTSFSFHEVSDVSSKRPIYLFKEDASSIRINLDGDDLGKLKLDISVRDNIVKANIVTEHPIVKEVIEINQGQLKDALSGHGLEISYLSVSVEGGQSEGLNYKEVIENLSSGKDHDREIEEEDAILACNTLYPYCVNIFA